MITSWNLICDKCYKPFSTAFPESDRCPFCGKSAIESMTDKEKELNIAISPSVVVKVAKVKAR